jgi:hypothetical protein
MNRRFGTCSVFRQGLFGNRFLLVAILCARAIHSGAMYTPGLRDLLEVMPVVPDQWMHLLLLALVLIVMDELHKHYRNVFTQHGDQSGGGGSLSP